MDPATAAGASPANDPASAGEHRAEAACPGHPDALGTAREIAFDPLAMPYVGTLQYKQTVPLARGEVILTFDDGPLPPMTSRVLDTLASECVKATFFIVGRMALAYPGVLQRAHREGHTIGTHSQNHPLIFPKLSQARGIGEIETGFASTNRVLEEIGAHTVPFFRFPGLGRTRAFEAFTKANGIAVFSVDLVADDWLHLNPAQVMQRALDRLEARGSGILLLHDIQPATAVMLPDLLRELKRRHFKVVHLVAPEGGFSGDPARARAGTLAAAAHPAAPPAPLPLRHPSAVIAAEPASSAAAEFVPLPPPRPKEMASLGPAAARPAKLRKRRTLANGGKPAARPQDRPPAAPFVLPWPRFLPEPAPARTD